MRCAHIIRSRGFTLLEMLVVLALVAAGMLATHSWLLPTLQKNRLQGAATQLLRALNLARSEAILRGEPVSLCPSRMHETGLPVCEGSYEQGWMLFTNPDRNGEFDSTSDEILQVYAPLRRGVTLTNRSGSRAVREAIHYLPSGAAHRNHTLMFCSDSAKKWGDISIVLNVVGRPRVQRRWGQCPETAA